MSLAHPRSNVEYGDFQTPLALALRVCQKLVSLGVSPDTVIEPTCGLGAFVEAAAVSFPSARRILGFDINTTYLHSLESRLPALPRSARIALEPANFFEFDWRGLLTSDVGTVLVAGNFPWVTNAQIGSAGGSNLPPKRSEGFHNGLDALTGNSNFDISEWMLMQVARHLGSRPAWLAMLCKSATARKFLKDAHKEAVGIVRAMLFGIDAREHFGVSVDACLLVCEFGPGPSCDDYDVYDSLDSSHPLRMGHRHGFSVRDLGGFEHSQHLLGQGVPFWRSGIKHDCAAVMELRERHGALVNGLGEVVGIEPLLVYPLLKSSDLANNRTDGTNRFMLVTQHFLGDDTERIRDMAPRTWQYLVDHARSFGRRKSRVYANQPPFAMFGIGTYTFAPYKVAISGLYKQLDFRLVGPLSDKPVVFDDTVSFSSFESKTEAEHALCLLNSAPARELLMSMIFWDDKRPIKSRILNRLDMGKLESALGGETAAFISGAPPAQEPPL